MKGLIEHIRTLVLFYLLELGLRSLPFGVQQLREVNKGEAGVATSPASKVEDNSGFHRSEKRIARACSSVVCEVGLVDTAVGRPGSSFADDPGFDLSMIVIIQMRGDVPLNHVHLSDDIMESNDF